MVVEEHLSCRSNLATALFLQTSTRCPSFAVNHFKIISVRSPYQLFLHVQNHAFPVSRALGGTCRPFKPFLQYFATGPDSGSCQDYEEYEYVECLSEETQIIDLFTHCKLQPHNLSQYMLATRNHHSKLFL